MGGNSKAEIIMEDGSIQLSRFSRKNKCERSANPRHGPWEAYFQAMWTHREHTWDQSPQSLYQQDVALSGNCVAVIGQFEKSFRPRSGLCTQISFKNLKFTFKKRFKYFQNT